MDIISLKKVDKKWFSKLKLQDTPKKRNQIQNSRIENRKTEAAKYKQERAEVRDSLSTQVQHSFKNMQPQIRIFKKPHF
jgi:hypothetical protein